MRRNQGRKGNHLRGKPDRPVPKEESFFSDVLEIILDSHFQVGRHEFEGPSRSRLVLGDGREKHGLDHVGGRQPKERRTEKVIKAGLRGNRFEARSNGGKQGGHDFGVDRAGSCPEEKGPVGDVGQTLAEIKVETVAGITGHLGPHLGNGVGNDRLEPTGRNGRLQRIRLVQITQIGNAQRRRYQQLLDQPHQVHDGTGTHQGSLGSHFAIGRNAAGTGAVDKDRGAVSQVGLLLGVVPHVG